MLLGGAPGGGAHGGNRLYGVAQADRCRRGAGHHRALYGDILSGLRGTLKQDDDIPTDDPISAVFAKDRVELVQRWLKDPDTRPDEKAALLEFLGSVTAFRTGQPPALQWTVAEIIEPVVCRLARGFLADPQSTCLWLASVPDSDDSLGRFTLMMASLTSSTSRGEGDDKAAESARQTPAGNVWARPARRDKDALRRLSCLLHRTRSARP